MGYRYTLTISAYLSGPAPVGCLSEDLRSGLQSGIAPAGGGCVVVAAAAAVPAARADDQAFQHFSRLTLQAYAL
jgi:hypothetical protein